VYHHAIHHIESYISAVLCVLSFEQQGDAQVESDLCRIDAESAEKDTAAQWRIDPRGMEDVSLSAMGRMQVCIADDRKCS
jgi:hypothetical protein